MTLRLLFFKGKEHDHPAAVKFKGYMIFKSFVQSRFPPVPDILPY